MVQGEKKFYQQVTLPSYEEKSDSSAPIPEKIGPYKVDTLLAKGGMSLLYLGIDPETKEARAIKVLSPEYLNHPEMVDHFMWEAKIISMTDHPNIVKVYDYGKWEEGLYIAMELIRGVSLRQFLTQQSFSLKRCLNIILQVAYALSHLHTHGVIHRDLKPENILIAEDGEVRVIDFGIAQLHEDELRATGKVMGTPSYMSPEQKEDPSRASFSSDIFALGIITYELVLGKLSYGMINLTLLPAGLQKIVAKALAVSPAERYQDVVPFIHDLTDYYKSPAIEKDRSGGDQVLEYMEILQRSEQSLSSIEKPKWNRFDIGFAKDRSPEQLGLYLDFFKFANNTSAIIIAHTQSASLAALAHISSLRGMIKTLVAPYLTEEKPFDLPTFTSTLNALVCQDKMKETFHLNILKLVAYNDTLDYVSCGQSGPLFHVPTGHNAPRTIDLTNPLIGETMGSVFNHSGDTFNDGDLLVFHNLPTAEFHEPLEKTLKANVLLSASRLSAALLESAQEQKTYGELRHPKAMFCIRRIS